MFIAAQKGYADIVKLLIDANADVHIPDVVNEFVSVTSIEYI